MTGEGGFANRGALLEVALKANRVYLLLVR
jgi:hypothetical protein